MKNIIPQKPSIISVTLLGSKARVNHSSLVDYDASAIACYLYIVNAGTSDYRDNNTQALTYLIDRSEVNFFDLPIPSISESQEYVIEIAVVDDMVLGANSIGTNISNISFEGSSLGTINNSLIESKIASAINISDPSRFTPIRGAYLTEVLVNTPDTLSNSAPPYLALNIAADNIENTRIKQIQIQVAEGYSGTVSGLTWSSIYTGNLVYSLSISTGLTLGSSYVFRTISEFSDGTTSTEYFDSDISDRGIQHPLTQIDYSSNISTPSDVTSVNFDAYASWDGTPTYELIMSWSWGGSDIGSIRHFEIQRIVNNNISNSTTLSSLDWSSPVQYSQPPSAKTLTMPAVPLNSRYAFRIRAVGWGSEENRYSSWVYSKVVLSSSPIGNLDFELIPSNSTPPVSTNIQVNDTGISAYKDWGGPGQQRTFNIDASTGNVTIGTEFIYDASLARLQIDGSAVINDITSASVVLDWISGIAPSIRTSTKTAYATGGSGMWAGYSDSNTFKFDLGDDSKYIRWDGNNLSISGGVTIDLPSDVSNLPPGALGYTTLSLTATNNIVLFKGADNTLRDNPTEINLNAATNGTSDFVNDLVWEVLDSNDNDITSQVLSDQYTGAPNSAKKLTVSTANGALSSYNNITVRVYYSPGSETWATSNIKDFTNIGKVKSFDEIAGLEEPFYAYLTNETQAVPVDFEGKNPYLADATGSFKLYQGTTDLSNSASTSYSIVVSDGCTITLSGNTYTVTAIPLTNGEPTKDTYSITVRGSYDTGSSIVTYDRVFSLFVSRQGAQGPQGDTGPQGVPGPKGDDGTTTYTWIKYADDASGSGISNSPTDKEYIGFAYNKTTATESNDPALYTWSRIQGGQGVQGPPGPDGTTYYTWIKYSPSSDGSNLTDSPQSNTLYIGIAVNKTTPTESTNKADYVWSRFKGEQGEQGPAGPDGGTGQRAPGWYEASTTQNPLNSSVWSGGTNSHAYSKLQDLVGPVFSYDTLTLYNSSNPSQTDTYMWNGSGWEAAVKINGNIIADGTVRARAIAADSGFFEEINVNRIYNHGGSSSNYKMMIDFQNGAIHIRGGN